LPETSWQRGRFYEWDSAISKQAFGNPLTVAGEIPVHLRVDIVYIHINHAAQEILVPVFVPKERSNILTSDFTSPVWSLSFSEANHS
jgi:hypothetical protein